MNKLELKLNSLQITKVRCSLRDARDAIKKHHKNLTESFILENLETNIKNILEIENFLYKTLDEFNKEDNM